MTFGRRPSRPGIPAGFFSLAGQKSSLVARFFAAGRLDSPGGIFFSLAGQKSSLVTGFFAAGQESSLVTKKSSLVASFFAAGQKSSLVASSFGRPAGFSRRDYFFAGRPKIQPRDKFFRSRPA